MHIGKGKGTYCTFLVDNVHLCVFLMYKAAGRELAFRECISKCIRNTQYAICTSSKRAIPSGQISIPSAIYYTHQCYDSIYAMLWQLEDLKLLEVGDQEEEQLEVGDQEEELHWAGAVSQELGHLPGFV